MLDLTLRDPLVLFVPIGATEIAFLVVLAFLLFGAKKIPELMRALGRAQGEFQKAKTEFEHEVKATTGTDAGTAPSSGDVTNTDAGPKPTDSASLERTQDRARELGIDPEGKDLDTLKREIADKVIGDV